MYETHTPCEKFTPNFIFHTLAKELVREDMNVVEMDYSTGVLVAESEPEFGSYAHRSYRKQWKFIIDSKGTIIARARIIETHTNDAGFIVYEKFYYMGDETHPENTWYWRVRVAMENICETASTSYSYYRRSAVQGENEEQAAAFILGVTTVAIEAALEASADD
jgi:hypothetical protein